MMNTRIYWLHALTPLHVGSGQGAGFIDLPIIREKVTHWPLVPGSAVKGVLADCHGATDEERGKDSNNGKLLRAAFGRSDADKEKDNAGSLVFTDARLICLAVRSLFGTFAWVTSPLALQRFKRDLDGAKVTEIPTSHCPISDQKIHLPTDAGSVLKLSDGKVYLEDLDFEAQDCDCAKEWGGQLSRWVFPGNSDWQKIFKERFAILPDNSFDFLCEMGTEINARIRIDDEKKTVAKGALWYEESLPAESILAGLVWCDRVFPKALLKPPEGKTEQQWLMETYCQKELTLQIGGKATIGKGQTRCIFTASEGASNGNP